MNHPRTALDPFITVCVLWGDGETVLAMPYYVKFHDVISDSIAHQSHKANVYSPWQSHNS